MQNKINIQIYFQLFLIKKIWNCHEKCYIIQYNHSRRSNRYSIEYNKKNTAFAVPKTKKNMNKLL